MLRGWGFLLAEMWVLLLLAVALGVLFGWLMWGGRREEQPLLGIGVELDAQTPRERERLAAQARGEALDDLPPMPMGAQGYVRPAAASLADRAVAMPLSPQPPLPKPAAPVAPPAAAPADPPRPAPTMPDAAQSAASPAIAPQPAPVAPQPVSPEPLTTGTRPAGLDAPLDGLPDDLTKIRGVGPKLARLCNDLGFWHYDQIASWTADEVDWVDAHLDGFRGRVSRDGWVEQARALAKNELPAFRRRR